MMMMTMMMIMMIMMMRRMIIMIPVVTVFASQSRNSNKYWQIPVRRYLSYTTTRFWAGSHGQK